MGPTEQDFLEYRRTGNTGALARVFDALAPELLLLAAHLTQDRARAEDLVQDTFLQAIESADLYKGEGRLGSWLAGILVRKAKKMRRSEARQPDPRRLEGMPELDPAGEAEARELADSLSESIASLTQPYRQVLNLRLVHGLTPVEISRTLERPPATVHTQLRRGLELLRQSLPRGLALPAAMLLGGRGLAVVREAVLHRATTVTAGGTALTLGGLVIMKKLAAILVVGALAAVGFWQLSPGSGEPLPPVENSLEQLRMQVARAESQEAPEEENVPEDRQPLASVPAPLASSDEAVLRGRIVAAETGAPLAGTRVTLSGGVRETADREPLRDPVDWTDPPRITTSADGVFEFRFTPPPEYSFMLRTSAADRASVGGEWGELQRGQVVDLGDVPLFVGAKLTGRVVDEKGEPVSGVSVLFQRPEETPYAAPLVPNFYSANPLPSDEDGHFAYRLLIVPGTWGVNTGYSGPDLVGPDSVLVPEGQESVQLEVVVKRLGDLPTLSGIVVDRTGTPVEGVELDAYSLSFGSDNSGESGPDGRFTIHRQSGGEGPVQIRQGSTDDFVLVEDQRHYEWGTDDIRVVVQRPASVTITVVEAETGKPVEDFGVRLCPTSGTGGTPRPEIRWRGHHEDGLLTIPSVKVGRHVAIVFPEDEGLIPGESAHFLVGDQGAALHVELHRPQPLAIRLVTGNGKPVPGSRVELIRMEGEGEITMSSMSGTPYESFSRFSFIGGDIDPLAIIMDTGVTDEDGTVVLQGPESRGGLAVKALGPGHTPLLHRGVSLTQDIRSVTVRVSTGASVHGTIGPRELIDVMDQSHLLRRNVDSMSKEDAGEYLDQYRPAIWLESESGDRYPGRTFHPGSGRVPLEPDGGFFLDGIPPGTWTVVLESREARSNGSRVVRRVANVRNLAEGESRTLDIDASSYLPGTLSAQVFLNGQPLRETDLLLLGYELDEGGRRVSRGRAEVQTNADGTFSHQTWPGLYTLWFEPKIDEEALGVPIESVEEVEILASRTAEQVFDLNRRVLRIRFLESDGTPATERYLYMLARYALAQSEAKTDPDGWLVVNPAPREPVVFETYPRGMSLDQLRQLPREEQEALRVRLGPVQIPAGEREAEITLRIPDGG